MKIRKSFFLVAAVCAFTVNAAFAQSSVSDINAGIAAYRAGDHAAARQLLEPAADRGEAKALRYLAYIMLEGAAPDETALTGGVDYLKQAAMAGDYVALVRLEDLRREGLTHSPSLDDMVEIESTRAADGDPVAAWRLARRFEAGDGVTPSQSDEAKWLEVAASAPPARFPKAGEAAFRLCQIKALGPEAADPEAARHWCGMAAEGGHAGAAIVLRRLASLAD